jgi:hypothetical protein
VVFHRILHQPHKSENRSNSTVQTNVRERGSEIIFVEGAESKAK